MTRTGRGVVYADELLRPWLDALVADDPGLAVFDAHTHLGTRDPSGFTATLDELTTSLELCRARALVFPMVEPGGYREPNLRCAEQAAASGGSLTALTRLTPEQDPVGMLLEGLEAGARGVKLHPSSDEFDLADERLQQVFEIADEGALPVLVHAGPELGSIGETVLRVCRRFPRMRVILAHCALIDLPWLWRRLPEAAHLYVDTSWWSYAHLMALFRLVPPGRILNASDLPFGTPVLGTISAVRCGAQAGLDREQRRSVAGGQLARLVAGEEPLDLGPAPTVEVRPFSPVLEILASSLLTALEPMQRGQSPGGALDVARHACRVAPEDADADVVASVRRLIELYDEHGPSLPARNQFAPGRDLVLAASVVARTPAAPQP